MSRISVILCCYNDAAWVRQALESLYRQTLPSHRYEVIFVNDGSTDDTDDMVQPFARHANFRYVKHRTNLGLPAACNTGLNAAGGDYITRLDADDTLEASCLERFCESLDQEAGDFAYCDYWETVAGSQARRSISLAPFDLYRLLAIGTVMRRELLLAVGGFRDVFWEEYDVYLRYLMKSGKPPMHIAQPLLTRVIRAGSMTSDPERLREGWRQLKQWWPQDCLERFGQLPAEAGESTVSAP